MMYKTIFNFDLDKHSNDYYICLPKYEFCEVIDYIFKNSKVTNKNISDKKISVDYRFYSGSFWNQISFEFDKNRIAKYNNKHYILSESNYLKLIYASKIINKVFEHNKRTYLKEYKKFTIFKTVIELDPYIKNHGVKLEIDDRYGKLIDPKDYTMTNDRQPWFRGVIKDKIVGWHGIDLIYTDPSGFVEKVKQIHYDKMHPHYPVDNALIDKIKEEDWNQWMQYAKAWYEVKLLPTRTTYY